MKKLFFCLFLILLIFPLLFSQIKQEEKKEPATKLESVLITKGNLLIKEFIHLDDFSYGTISFDSLILYEPNKESQKAKGIRAGIKDLSSSITRSEAAFLDLEEIENVLNSINYMIDLVAKWKSQNKSYTEVIYSTKGDFQIGFYQDGIKQKGFVSCGYIGRVSRLINIEELTRIKAIFEKGLSILKEK